VIEFIRVCWTEYRNRSRKAKEARAKFLAAKYFNRIHAYAGWCDSTARWMCPTCNEVHLMVEKSPWVGRVFPACCDFPKGERWSRAEYGK